MSSPMNSTIQPQTLTKAQLRDKLVSFMAGYNALLKADLGTPAFLTELETFIKSNFRFPLPYNHSVLSFEELRTAMIGHIEYFRGGQAKSDLLSEVAEVFVSADGKRTYGRIAAEAEWLGPEGSGKRQRVHFLFLIEVDRITGVKDFGQHDVPSIEAPRTTFEQHTQMETARDRHVQDSITPASTYMTAPSQQPLPDSTPAQQLVPGLAPAQLPSSSQESATLMSDSPYRNPLGYPRPPAVGPYIEPIPETPQPATQNGGDGGRGGQQER